MTGIAWVLLVVSLLCSLTAIGGTAWVLHRVRSLSIPVYPPPRVPPVEGAVAGPWFHGRFMTPEGARVAEWTRAAPIPYGLAFGTGYAARCTAKGPGFRLELLSPQGGRTTLEIPHGDHVDAKIRADGLLVEAGWRLE